MSDRKSNLPRKAVWLLQHVCPGDNEALTGDLIERFREGQTRGWFWRQVLMACAVGILTAIRRRWPYFCYAAAGVAMPALLGKTAESVPAALHWYALPWPWSQLVFEGSRNVLLGLEALPVLAAALVINRQFHWVSLFRTGVINVALIVLCEYLFDYLVDAFPWLRGPFSIPEYEMLVLSIIPLFSSFLVSAWLGCVAPPKAARAVT